MFLPDSQVTAMTGISRDEHRPVKLYNWLIARGWVENETFFERADGWYSVMAPQARAFVPERPQLRLPA
jgi:hypothetical protein